MAKKITLLRSSEQPHGALTHTVLYWYTVSPAILDSKGNVVVFMTRVNLPSDVIITGSARYLSDADLTALDAGQNAFEQLQHTQTAGETLNAFSARLELDHAIRQTWWIAARRKEVERAGTATAT